MTEESPHKKSKGSDATTPSISQFADEVTAEIFAFTGAIDTARCAQVCKNWNQVSRNSRALWRHFCHLDYGLSNKGSESADWYAVYAYIRRQQHVSTSEFIPSALVFCDDGSHQPGNDPQHALGQNGDVCWCTNAFVDRDVDLVADLTVPHLVLALEVANGSARFSAPVKEALAFASFELPNLDQARQYDGTKGIELARELSTHTNTLDIQKLPPGHPLAGFCFPDIPRAYSAQIQQPALRPTVARYVHFKLLSSSKCVNRVSNNIDVCNLFAFGVPLPELGAMIHAESNDAPPDPSRYARRHKVRDYPWHIHDAFQQQEQQQMMQGEQERLNRMLQEMHQLEQDRLRMVRENRMRLQQLEDLVAAHFEEDEEDEE